MDEREQQDQDLEVSNALARLEREYTLFAEARDLVRFHVEVCRDVGATWTAIAQALGVSRQAVTQRYGASATTLAQADVEGLF